MTRAGEMQTTVVLADPPWPHANGSRTNSGKSPKYQLMKLCEIAALGSTVRELAGPNAVLYLWATSPHLPGAIQVIASWGFVYRSVRVWRKARVACGFWVRSNAEVVLIAERGRPLVPPTTDCTIFEADPIVPGAHSSKPAALHQSIERRWPAAHKVELFAVRRRSGWSCYGKALGTRLTPIGVARC